MAARKTKRRARDPERERYAIVLQETSNTGSRLGYHRVLLRNLTPEQATYWIRKFERDR